MDYKFKEGGLLDAASQKTTVTKLTMLVIQTGSVNFSSFLELDLFGSKLFVVRKQ